MSWRYGQITKTIVRVLMLFSLLSFAYLVSQPGVPLLPMAAAASVDEVYDQLLAHPDGSALVSNVLAQPQNITEAEFKAWLGRFRDKVLATPGLTEGNLKNVIAQTFLEMSFSTPDEDQQVIAALWGAFEDEIESYLATGEVPPSFQALWAAFRPLLWSSLNQSQDSEDTSSGDSGNFPSGSLPSPDLPLVAGEATIRNGVLTFVVDAAGLGRLLDGQPGGDGPDSRLEINLGEQQALIKTAFLPVGGVRNADRLGWSWRLDYGDIQLDVPAGALLSASSGGQDSGAGAGQSGALSDGYLSIKVAATPAAGLTAAAREAAAGVPGLRLPGGTYDLEVSLIPSLETGEGQGLELQHPVLATLTVPEVTSDSPGLNLDLLGVYRLDAGAWIYMGGRVDREKRTVSVLLPSFSTYAVLEYRRAFSDTAGHWAQADIEVMAARHIARGTAAGTFLPETQVTRAEFVAFLTRTLGLDRDGEAIASAAAGGTVASQGPGQLTAAPAGNFSDVTLEAWYGPAVQAAVEAGLIKGYEDGSFRPAAPITRQELAVIIGRALGEKRPSLTASQVEEKVGQFADAGEIAPWARQAVAEAMIAGIVRGRDNAMFAPVSTATRAETVVMLRRLADLIF